MDKEEKVDEDDNVEKQTVQETDMSVYPEAEVSRARAIKELERKEKIKDIIAAGGDLSAMLKAEVLEQLGGVDFLTNLIRNNSNNAKFAGKIIGIFLCGDSRSIKQENTQINVDVGNALKGIFDDIEQGKKK